MKSMRRLGLLWLLIVSILVTVGCDSAPGPLQSKPDFIGVIKEIHPIMSENALAQILVESNNDDLVTKYMVTIDKDTMIFEQGKDELRPMNFEMMEINDKVEIWFSGPVKESFPMQVTAKQLVVTGTTIPTHHALAVYWAPVFFQDIDYDNYRADYITNFDFDGDWNSLNNWENMPDYELKAYVYYWVVETTTHWFIGYAVFHPRDWSDDITAPFDQHENDMEGCLLVIAKEYWQYGEFILMITRAHEDFYSYKDHDRPLSNEVTDDREDIDGDVEFEEHHPYIYIKAEGHAIYGDLRWEDRDFPSGDGVIYRYTGIAEEPGDSNDRNAGYDLIYIGDLWDKRNDPDLFYEFGTFRGEDWGKNKADAPWGWDDKDDGEVYADQFFIDPAYVIDYYHDGLGNFSHSYVLQFQN